MTVSPPPENSSIENSLFDQTNLQRVIMQSKLTRIELIYSLINLPIWLVLAVLFNSQVTWMMAGLSLLMILFFLLVFWLCRVNQVRPSIYLSIVVFYLMVTAAYFILDADHTGILYLVCSVSALALINLRSAIIVTLVSAATTAVIYCFRSGFFVLSGSEQKDQAISFWTNFLLTEIMIFLIFGIIVFFYRNMETAVRLSSEQSKRLEKALYELEVQRNQVVKVSQEMLTTTGELNQTATQQASSAAQQVTTITEVNSSLKELDETISQIAGSATLVGKSAGHVLETAMHVQSTASQAASDGVNGQQLVKAVIAAVNEVGGLYQNLTDTLVTLSENAQGIRQMLALIRDISDQTHLLSLNAAIEAAGAGEFGNRFGVVAQEVKTLANNSLQASGEVSALVQRVEQSVQEAVEIAENGKLRVREAINTAEKSGQVMDNLADVTNQAAEGTASIATLNQEVKRMAEGIGLATEQQNRAGKQVIEALSEITVAAHQTSAFSEQLWRMAQSLEGLSNNLEQTLAESAATPKW